MKTIKHIQITKHLLFILITTCILVSCSEDDPNSPQTSVQIPDENFEQALIDLGYDTNGLNGNILRSDAENITELEIGYKEINDLTGVNEFFNLERLNCEGNYLPNLDISNLSVLKTLVCEANAIETINFHEQSLLEHINCNSNELSTIDVSSSPNLRYFDCAANELIALNLSLNTQLINLIFSRNNLTEIDLTNNLSLTKIYGSRNNLDHLNVNLNELLQTLVVHNNQLQELFVKNGNNTNITTFSATNNPGLTCIEVDNPNLSAFNWGNHVDPQVTFLVNCN